MKFTNPEALRILKEEQRLNEEFFAEMDAKIEAVKIKAEQAAKKEDERPKYDYQVKRADGTIVNAGTDEHSWLTLEQARGYGVCPPYDGPTRGFLHNYKRQ